MKIGRQDQHSSAISTSNEETIVVRGRDLARELIGTISFTEHFWLLVTGAMPVRRAAPGARCDAGRHRRARPGAERAGVAHDLRRRPRGAAGCGRGGHPRLRLGGARLLRGRRQFFAAIAKPASIRRESIADAAQTVVREYRSARRSIPGYGHPLHKRLDPRAQRLFEIAAEARYRGRHVADRTRCRDIAAGARRQARWR